MATRWFQALSESDNGVAEALAPFQDVSPPEPAADPAESAETVRRWLKNQFPGPNMLIVPGTRQMDLIEPLLQRIGDLRLLLLEREAERLAAALNGVDTPALAEAIRTGRVVLDLGTSEDEGVVRFMRAADFSRVPVIRLLDARPLSEEENRLADDLTRPARELLRWQACDMSTRLRFGPDWQKQTVQNIPHIIRHPGIGTLFGRFAGKPALVIAAGPSLDEALPHIQRLRKQFVVISIARPVGRMKRHAGLVPDLIVTGDGQSLVKKQFQYKLPEVPVAASCYTHPDVIRGLNRIFFMEMESMGLPDWLRGKIGELGQIHSGGNVATAAMSVAVALGCNPVLTVGLDLSYPESGKMHAAGKAGEAAASKLPEGPLYYDVPGNYQPTVKTNRQMMHYIDFTEELIAHHSDTTFININTAGARIDGAVLERPEDMEKHAAEPFDAASVIRKVYEDNLPGGADASRFCESLRADLPVLQSLRTECLDAAMTCNQMIMLMRRPGRKQEAEETARASLAKLEPLDERLKNDPVMNLIEARLEGASRLLAERMMSPEERAMDPAVRSFWRWREFYKSVAEASRWSADLLQDVIREIEPPPPMSEPVPDLKANPEPVEMLV